MEGLSFIIVFIMIIVTLDWVNHPVMNDVLSYEYLHFVVGLFSAFNQDSLKLTLCNSSPWLQKNIKEIEQYHEALGSDYYIYSNDKYDRCTVWHLQN